MKTTHGEVSRSNVLTLAFSPLFTDAPSEVNPTIRLHMDVSEKYFSSAKPCLSLMIFKSSMLPTIALCTPLAEMAEYQGIQFLLQLRLFLVD